MSLLIGDQLILNAYIGETPVLRIYKGNTLVDDFTNEPSPSPSVSVPSEPTNVSISVEDDI